MDDTVTNKDINNNIIDSLPNNNNNILDTNRTATPMPTYPEEDIEFIDYETSLEEDNEEVTDVTDEPNLLTATLNKKTKVKMDLFIKAYSEVGTVKDSMALAGIKSRRTVELWRRWNKFGFKQRLDSAQLDFNDKLEAKLFSLVLSKEMGVGSNQIGLLAALNAHKPDKYRPNVQNTDDTASSLMSEMRRIFKMKNAPETVRLEPGSDEQVSQPEQSEPEAT